MGVDLGAQKTFIGEPKTRACCALLDINLLSAVKGRKFTFKFGEPTHEGIGNIRIRAPVSSNFFLSFTADVVEVDVPLLLGLYLLTQARLTLDFAEALYIGELTDGLYF